MSGKGGNNGSGYGPALLSIILTFESISVAVFKALPTSVFIVSVLKTIGWFGPL